MGDKSTKGDFKKGNRASVGYGRPKIAPEVRAIREAGTESIIKMFNEFRLMNKEQLKTKMEDPNSTLEELALGKILAEAIKSGDQSKLNFIYDRSVGPIVVKSETTVKGNLHSQVMDAIRRNNKQDLESE